MRSNNRDENDDRKFERERLLPIPNSRTTATNTARIKKIQLLLHKFSLFLYIYHDFFVYFHTQ